MVPKLRGHDPWPTVIGAVLVGWNVRYWKHPDKHISRMAGKHPAITLLVTGYYLDHFLREWMAEHVRSLRHDQLRLRLPVHRRGSLNGGLRQHAGGPGSLP